MDILKRTTSNKPNSRRVPCVERYEYSYDNGDTWVSYKEYYKWRQQQFTEILIARRTK